MSKGARGIRWQSTKVEEPLAKIIVCPALAMPCAHTRDCTVVVINSALGRQKQGLESSTQVMDTSGFTRETISFTCQAGYYVCVFFPAIFSVTPA